jgi:hypothetical protein
MKLRNKKTGKIVDVESLGHDDSLKEKFGYQVTLSWKTEYENLSQCKDYTSLAELNEEWEDYTPKEPLIKDDKIRKAVRAWAEACNIERCLYDGDGDFATRWHGIKLDCSQIELDEGHYSIAELCGEEEQCES